MWIFIHFIILGAFVVAINGDADITIQLISYSNPTFGLARDDFYCAYQSASIPPPANPNGNPPMMQGYQQNNQYPQTQPNQPYQPNQQIPYQSQNPIPYRQTGQYQNGYAQNQQNAYQQSQQINYQNQQNQQIPYQNQQNIQNPYQNQQNQQYPQTQPFQQNQQYPQNGQYPNQAYQNQNQQYMQNQQNGYRQTGQYQNQYQQYQQQQPQQQQPQTQQLPYRAIKQQQCIPPPTGFPVPNWNECKFSFSTIFSTVSGEPVVITTGLIPIPSNTSTILFNQTGWNDKCIWQNCNDQTWYREQYRTFKIKPNLVEVLVTHYGDSVFRTNNQYTPVGNDQAYLVDSIGINIVDLVPAAATVSPAPVYLICANGEQKSGGNPLSTLTLTVSVRCRHGYHGQFCNLTNCSTYDNHTQICSSALYPGQSLVCDYNSTLLQPVNCTMCQFGVASGRCRTEDSLLRTAHTNVTGYIVGISILSILLAIAIVIIIILLFVYRDSGKPRASSSRGKSQVPAQSTTSSAWVPSFLITKSPKNDSKPPGKNGYTAAPQEDEVEWMQPRVAIRDQAQPQRPFNLPPPPNRQPPSSGSSPEHNGSRREAAV